MEPKDLGKSRLHELLDLAVPTTATMEQVVYTTSTEIVCKFCGSNNVVKDGGTEWSPVLLVQSLPAQVCGEQRPSGNAYPP
jgi:hypothetical protein